ncbi:MAG: AAA family ATPase [candidate division Zixibacteria bacterium]|nr:AAA family ATPase [candidate division Zixibacteria bacterium]
MTKRRLQFTRTAPGQDRAAPRLVSILSGKGGVGKSVLTYNLADRLASAGKRVLMVDLDIGCGNLHILANTAGQFGVTHLVAGELSLAEAVTPVREGLDLLAANGCGWPRDMSASTGAAKLAHSLRSQQMVYDLILVDHPSGKSEATIVLAAASDVNLLLVVPELTSIADACGLYKQLLKTDRLLDCRLLVNRAETDGEAEYIHQKFGALTERFYGRPPGYLGRLLEDRAFRQAVAAQAPLAAVDNDTPSIADLDAMAAQLVPGNIRVRTGRRSHDEKAINNVPAEADIRE